ncbi:hypothetical protein AB0I81_63410 [Nonomuraea sp. NPDC050404]|uniref:hypothetical protein n=1 Tax=Nonomuraea sp. NPDC050404 TaxID=3155783 RepID=UPI00340612A0
MDNKTLINFLHPTNPSQLLSVKVPRDSSAAWLVQQMINAGFIPQASDVGQYKLQDTRSNNLLHDTQSLADAGIQDGANLRVIHATSGAGRG